MQVLRGKAEQAAQHDLPVLITGEKGSGRENLARFIHGQSGRDGLLVCMDHCELTAENSRTYLLGRDSAEAEQEGLFDRARGSTLFIPDLQDIPTDTLKIIHQVLDSGHYVHEGSSGVRNMDCRLIVSACDELLELAGRDETLQQLYYRLNVLPLRPATAERPTGRRTGTGPFLR